MIKTLNSSFRQNWICTHSDETNNSREREVNCYEEQKLNLQLAMFFWDMRNQPLLHRSVSEVHLRSQSDFSISFYFVPIGYEPDYKKQLLLREYVAAPQRSKHGFKMYLINCSSEHSELFLSSSKNLILFNLQDVKTNCF